MTIITVSDNYKLWRLFPIKERYVNGLGTCIIVRLSIETQKEIRRKKRINYNNYHFSSSIVLYISHTFICEKCVFLPNILKIGNVFYNMCLYALHAMHYKEQMLIIPP